MKITFITIYYLNNVDWESGTFDFMANEIERQGRVVYRIGQVGINAFLHIVGINFFPCKDDKSLIFHGYIDKSRKTDLNKLDSIYGESDIFLLSTLDECFFIMFVETAAYGVPSFAYNLKAVSSSVKDGKSRILFNPDEYRKLVASAQEHYERYGRWEHTVSTPVNLIEEECPGGVA